MASLLKQLFHKEVIREFDGVFFGLYAAHKRTKFDIVVIGKVTTIRELYEEIIHIFAYTEVPATLSNIPDACTIGSGRVQSLKQLLINLLPRLR